jgi:gliding motility-associated-like protein
LGTAATSYTASGATYTVTNLAVGTYTFTVTNAATCTSGVSAPATINIQPATPATPSVGTITQPNCTSNTGSIELSGLPSGNWVINPGGIAASGASITIAGLAPGIYNYTVTNSAGCPSLPTANITIVPQPITPVAPQIGTIIAPTCALPTGSVELTGLPAGNWTINPGAIIGNGATKIISGLASGNYTFTVTNSVGCPSALSAIANIPVQPITPVPPSIGTITPPTCIVATGVVELNNLPLGNWEISQFGTSTNTYTGTGNTFTTPDLSEGNYTFTVKNSDGCTSSSSSIATIITQPPTPQPELESGVFCVNQETGVIIRKYTLDTKLDTTHTFVWYLDGGVLPTQTGNTLEAQVPGIYSVTATNTFGCTSNVVSAVVIKSYIGQEIALVSSGSFNDSTSITANISPTSSEFMYQLDNGPFQSSNIFENASPGTHTVRVKDAADCTDLQAEITILGYPKFFTPNDDNYNDTWNIIGSKNQNDQRIFIYDRYGVFLKQISPTSSGWDGTFNGQKLPADDYWFTVEYTENNQQKIFKSHFALKR